MPPHSDLNIVQTASFLNLKSLKHEKQIEEASIPSLKIGACVPENESTVDSKVIDFLYSLTFKLANFTLTNFFSSEI